ncbi:ankyrin repeat domain-containing protein 50-like [Sycon ciliatum]|uniref:ankyrin repeat domain-containing protein 50-like n=1 Tax=Sycon ciliatum TaxID=27933 RepID=UPI0031F69EB6
MTSSEDQSSAVAAGAAAAMPALDANDGVQCVVPSSVQSRDLNEDEFDARLACLATSGHLTNAEQLQLVASLIAQTVFKPADVALSRLRAIRPAAEAFVRRLTTAEEQQAWSRYVLAAPVEPQCRRTALHICAASDRYQHALVLLRMGWDVDTRDIRDWTPLRTAYVHGSERVMRLLYEHSRDRESRACIEEHDLLLQHVTTTNRSPSAMDADSDSTGSASSSGDVVNIHRAIVRNDTSLALRLIESCTETHGHGGGGGGGEVPSLAGTVYAVHHPLNFIDGSASSASSQTSVVDTVSDAGQSALFYAAMLGRGDVVRRLVRVPHVQLSRQLHGLRLTALAAAMCRGHEDVVRVLLAAGSTAESGNAALRVSDIVHGFLYGVFSPDPACLRLLCEDARTHPCREQALAEAALFTACSLGCQGTVRALVEAGVDVNTNAWSLNGETPIMRAMYHGHAEVVEYLSTCPGITYSGICQPYMRNESILHRAVYGGSVWCLKKVLTEHTDSGIHDNHAGLKPFSMAARYNQRLALRVLLQHAMAGERRLLHARADCHDDGGGAAGPPPPLPRRLGDAVIEARRHADPGLMETMLASSVYPLRWWAAAAVALRLPTESDAALLPLPETVKEQVREFVPYSDGDVSRLEHEPSAPR